jgi:hypothetical protein
MIKIHVSAVPLVLQRLGFVVSCGTAVGSVFYGTWEGGGEEEQI